MTTPSRSRRLAATGFTLVELLVVVTILAVLVALVFPVLRGAFKKTKQTVALNNLRQIGTATLAYVGEHENQLPARHVGTKARKWPELLLPYLGVKTSEDQEKFPVPKAYRIPVETPEAGYDVIDDGSEINSSGGNRLAVVMNGYNDLGAYNVGKDEPPLEIRVNRLHKPSEVILLGLKLPKKYDYYMDFKEGRLGNNNTVLNPAAYGEGSNYLFADGSARYLKAADYRQPYVTPAGETATYSYGDWLWLANKDETGVIKPPKS